MTPQEALFDAVELDDTIPEASVIAPDMVPDGMVPDGMVPDGMVQDEISGKHLKETPKETVRQRVARILISEYALLPEDMAIDFAVRNASGGKARKVDIAVFKHGEEHKQEHLTRCVVCRPEPKASNRAVRIRDFEQAREDLEELEEMMDAAPSCVYGLWTNGLESYYVHKRVGRFDNEYHPVGDWPPADETAEPTASVTFTRPADAEALRMAFRRCHNFIHGNEGMPKDAAFWQFLYLIFCKIYDEQQVRRGKAERRFFAGARELFNVEGRKKIRMRIDDLFKEVKQNYDSIFRGNEEITLSDRALEFMVSELSKYDLLRTDMDAKGAAYQEIVGNNLRGDRGQYFTPRGVIDLAVQILDPKPTERVLDPACGTGGFLVAVLAHLRKHFEREAHVEAVTASTEDYLPVLELMRDYAERYVFGADFDPFLIRATQMNMVMAGDGRGHLYNINSLEFPRGHLENLDRAVADIPLGSIDVLLTNPPFGSDIPVTDANILDQYELAKRWERTEDKHYRNTGTRIPSVPPEILFIERCIKWLRPGGRLAMVLPNGILGNPAAEYIRWWILRHTWVLASVDLPVEVFIVEANVNILTSLLFLKRKTDEEMMSEALTGSQEYPIFMAVAEKVGFDRRGKTSYKRHPNGEEITEEVEKDVSYRVGEKVFKRHIHRRERIVDNDLPVIAARYREFRTRYAEPGEA